MTDNSDFLNVHEAAQYLGFSVNYMYKLTAGHLIPFCHPTGRKLIFRRSELDKWIDDSRVPTSDELRMQKEVANDCAQI